MLSAKIGYFRPTGFDPRSISGLVGWWDAADASTLTIDTGVSQWRDKSGRGLHLSQEIANGQPASGTRTIGGRNALNFDGSNDHLVTGFTIGDFTTSRAFTAFVVQATDTVSATLQTQLWLDRSLSGDSSGWAIARRTFRPEFVIGSGVLTSASSSVAYRRFDDSTTAATIYAASASASAGTMQAWKNNTLQTLTLAFGSLATANFLSQGSANHRLLVGAGSSIASSDAAEWFHDGVIGEVIVYSAALSSAQITAVNSYLGAKWGITVA
jgi:hypothetical protein